MAGRRLNVAPTRRGAAEFSNSLAVVVVVIRISLMELFQNKFLHKPPINFLQEYPIIPIACCQTTLLMPMDVQLLGQMENGKG